MQTYRGFLGSAGTRFVDQRSSDIYYEHFYRSNAPILHRQTYVCIARGLGGIFVESVENPRAPAAFGDEEEEGAEADNGGHMPIHGGHPPAHGGQDGFYVEDNGHQQQQNNNPEHLIQDLLWQADDDGIGEIAVFDCGPSINPPLANPVQLPIVNVEIDGEVPRLGYNMPWNRNMTELRVNGDPLHYHRHYPRIPGYHGPLPPPILPEGEGTCHAVDVIHHGTQIQVFRRARIGQLVGGGQGVAG